MSEWKTDTRLERARYAYDAIEAYDQLSPEGGPGSPADERRVAGIVEMAGKVAELERELAREAKEIQEAAAEAKTLLDRSQTHLRKALRRPAQQ